jgi:bifunctional enzyme CysN/CysC
LRLLTCGGVDDGKSTLIGRLLFDLNLVPSDELRWLDQEAKSSGRSIDLAFLLDGLEAEREQGITIDVAYRQFRTPRRSFIVADAPGHEQYTRNMATGASTSDLAVLLVDARKGLLTQTRRHSLIASHFGIRHVVLVVNKLDLVNFSSEVFGRIASEFVGFASDLGFRSVTAIPTSALLGDNIARGSTSMAWYEGPTLLQYLEAVDVVSERAATAFRMPIQSVCRPNADFRGLSGTVRSGVVRVGDAVTAAGSQHPSRVGRLIGAGGECEIAVAGDAITIGLESDVDASRGDVLCHPDAAPPVADQFAAHVLWLGDAPMIPGRSYLMKIGTRKLPGEITALKHRVDVNSGAHAAAKTLGTNEIGFCNVALAAPTAIDPFGEMRETGSFILIERASNATVGAGMVAFPLRRAANVHPQALEVSQKERAAIKPHRATVLWFTGLSGAGKSTIASAVERKLNLLGCHTYLLDGDNVRGGLNRDLGFTEADRVENVRRVQEVARLFADAGLIVIVSLISPFRSERLRARELMNKGEFVEIFVDTPIEVCRDRDPKGLYAKAARGELVNFTGVDSPYEPPEQPELRLDTVTSTPDSLAERVVDYLRATAILER